MHAGGDATLTAECYAKLDDVPPMFKKQVRLAGARSCHAGRRPAAQAAERRALSQITAGTAAVGTAALMSMRDEQDIIRSVLAEEADAPPFMQADALVKAIDAVMEAMPQPSADQLVDDEEEE